MDNRASKRAAEGRSQSPPRVRRAAPHTQQQGSLGYEDPRDPQSHHQGDLRTSLGQQGSGPSRQPRGEFRAPGPPGGVRTGEARGGEARGGEARGGEGRGGEARGGEGRGGVARGGEARGGEGRGGEARGREVRGRGTGDWRGPGAVIPSDTDTSAGPGGSSSSSDPSPTTSARRSRYSSITTRPAHIQDKRGSSGTPLNVVTNYVEVTKTGGCSMFQYLVEYDPEILSKPVRQMLLKQHRELLGRARAFDGRTLFLPHRLEQEPTALVSTRKHDQATIQVKLTLINEIPPTSPINLHIFNIIFKRILNMLGLKLIGRHYYDQTQGVAIPQHQLEVWPGFVTSILKHEGGVMLMLDVSHKLLRTLSVLDSMYGMYEGIRHGQDFQTEATKALVGQIALTKYNNRTYRIDDFDWDSHPSSTFQKRNGEEMSYNQYYQDHYQLTIQDQDQPMLVSRPKKVDAKRGMDQPIYLVPELCYLTGMSDEARANFHVMKDIAVHTRISPDVRVKRLARFLSSVHGSADVQEELAGWGMQFSGGLLDVAARCLKPEKILQAGVSYDYKPDSADWSREMRGNALPACEHLDAWAVIHTRRDSGVAQDLIQTMSRVAPPMGIRVQRPQTFELNNDAIHQFLDALGASAGQGMKMAVCILPTNRKDRYDAIKKFCCVQNALPSQVVVARTLQKKQMLMSVCTKIAIQINCKLGGIPWELVIPSRGLMVVGVDNYRDSTRRGTIMAAVVASLNDPLTAYHSQCLPLQTADQQMPKVAEALTKSLRAYHKRNMTLPKRVIIYEDAISDGLLEKTFKEQVPLLQQALEALGTPRRMKMALVLVKKRVNTRIFNKGQYNLSNPPPGTVLDHSITRPEFYDFFLVSQSVRQGTVTPCHFNVIWDDTGLKPDHMQMLTYKLCHLYFNWPGTIRVPAPCQYAHKLAYLVSQSLHQDTHEQLADKLYYL